MLIAPELLRRSRLQTLAHRLKPRRALETGILISVSGFNSYRVEE